MSRLYTNSPRGRQPLLGSTVKFSKSSKQHPNDTYQPNGKKSKSIRAATVTKKSIGKRKREDTPASGHSSATFCGFDSADDASDEDSEEDLEDEDNLPAVKAPSRSRKVNVAGRKPDPIPDNVSVAGSDNMFGGFDNYYEDDEDPNFSPEENRKRFEEKIFADSDDDGDIDVYQAVDDISDSDDDLDEQRIQDQEVLAMLPEDVFSDTDFLNQIDGMSAYGFGNDSDTSIYRFPSSQDGDSATEGVAERHVHFAADADPTLFMRLSASPTITRALLPSALPDTGSSAHSTAPRVGGLVDDLDDSDLTDDCLPREALQSTHRRVEEKATSPPPSPQSKKSGKTPARRKGPRRGIFIDEGDKTSGILDSSGKIILMTNPHLLGEEFARRYGASQTSSPDDGLVELMEGSDAASGDRASADAMVAHTPDIMLASLNSAANGPLTQGQAIGPLEAFYPSSNFAFDDEPVADFQGDDIGEDVIDMTHLFRFDSDSEDSERLASPVYMPKNQSFMSDDFSHLNGGNVTAFRRNADPAMRKLPQHLDINLTSSPLATPATRRRKRNHSSPYTSSHYKGVTPVQRMRDPNSGRTPEDATPAKKRKLMT